MSENFLVLCPTGKIREYFCLDRACLCVRQLRQLWHCYEALLGCFVVKGIFAKKNYIAEICSMAYFGLVKAG